MTSTTIDNCIDQSNLVRLFFFLSGDCIAFIFSSAAPLGMWDPSSPTRNQTLEVQSLNHWTAREVSEIFFLNGFPPKSLVLSEWSLTCHGQMRSYLKRSRSSRQETGHRNSPDKKLNIQVLLKHLSTCPIYGRWPLQGQRLQRWPSPGNSRRTNQLGPGSFKTSSFPGTFLKMASRQEMGDQETSSWRNTFGN